MKKNNKKTNRIIGDKRTHNSRDIPFFWSTKRYLNENIYHLIASICVIVLILVVIACIIVASAAKGFLDTDQQSTHTQKHWMIFAIPGFICVFLFAICKINERKVRKQRIRDLASTESRTIEFD